MKKVFEGFLVGRSSFLNGLLALAVVGMIAFGCTCNDKEGFNWGSKSNSNSSDEKDKSDEKDEKNTSDASKGEKPSDDELEEIVKATLLDFDRAIKNEDFTDFYDSTSEAFQKSTSPRRLKRKFDAFIKGRADLTPIRNMEPDYSRRPKVDKSRRMPVLMAKGEFPTKPKPSQFDLKYVPEGKEWKLIGIYVVTNIRKSR